MTTLAPPLARWLGAADSSAPDQLWETSDVPDVSHLTRHMTTVSDSVSTAVLTISGMPRALRPRIETAMVVCVPSDSELSVPDADPLTAHWFTPWQRSVSVDDTDADGAKGGIRVACRQVLTGSENELGRLRAVVENLAREHDFEAELILA